MKSKTPIMRFFEFSHLPPALQGVSGDVYALACSMDATLPDGAEKSAGLRKLLEAKDCFVRAALPVPQDVKDLTSPLDVERFDTRIGTASNRIGLGG